MARAMVGGSASSVCVRECKGNKCRVSAVRESVTERESATERERGSRAQDIDRSGWTD
jgi:hypothetical protein